MARGPWPPGGGGALRVGRAAARAPSAPRASGDRGLTAAVREERLLQDLRARGGAAAERPVSSRSGPSAPPTVGGARPLLPLSRGDAGDRGPRALAAGARARRG